MSLHPLSLNPYVAPGTSFSVHYNSRFLASKTIKGVIACPDALIHPTTVICPLFLDKTPDLFWPFFVKTYGNQWSSVTPDLSTLYTRIWPGLFIKSFSFSVLFNNIILKYFSNASLSVTASKQTMAARSPLQSWSWGCHSKNLLNHTSLICFFFNKPFSLATFSTIPISLTFYSNFKIPQQQIVLAQILLLC